MNTSQDSGRSLAAVEAGMKELDAFSAARCVSSTDTEGKLKNGLEEKKGCTSNCTLQYLAIVSGFVVFQVFFGVCLSDIFSSSNSGVSESTEVEPRYASNTSSKGYSVMLEIPELQEVCDYVSQRYGTRRTPAGMRLLFEVTLHTEENMRTDFKRFVKKLRAMNITDLEYSPSGLDAGRSTTWNHNYADLALNGSENKTHDIYQLAQETFGYFQVGTNRYQGNRPRICLGCSSTSLKSWLDSQFQWDLVSRFPNLLKKNVNVARVSLWNTNGTTDKWVRLESADLSE